MKHIKLFESFINESHAYICGTCGERAEHEEIEANPKMKCSNCGDCNWQVEESETNEAILKDNIEIPTKPFFIEATDKTIADKLIKAGIKGKKKLPPPIVGITADGVMWEMFMHNEGSKKGWMIHPTHRKIKPEFIDKYMNENVNVESPKITITPQYHDEKDNRKQSIKYDVNYQISVNGQEIEIEGVLKPYHTGRAEEYEFEPGWFAEDADSDYYDEHSEEIEEQILAQFSNASEGQEVMVADMKGEAEGLISEIKDSLDFASAKLYDLKKMSDYIKGDYPELSKQIADLVEPMMTEFETEYPNKFKELLTKFN
jgi:hypothetical protein